MPSVRRRAGAIAAVSLCIGLAPSVPLAPEPSAPQQVPAAAEASENLLKDPERRQHVIVGGVIDYWVRPGDTLRSIGARYGVSVAALTDDNGVKPDAKLVVGELLRIDNRHIVPFTPEPGTLLINVPQRMLYYTGDRDRVDGYAVAVGRRNWQTPTSEFVVISKEREPTWDVPASILEESRQNGRSHPDKVPPGPDNPLGAFWIGLNRPGIGIHGTNVPSSIFRAATHGCIRMHPDDIAQLFERVHVGMRGRIIYEPVLLAAHDGAVFLEVHPDVYRRESMSPIAMARALAQTAGWTDRIDWDAAALVVLASSGIARDVTLPPGTKGVIPCRECRKPGSRITACCGKVPASVGNSLVFGFTPRKLTHP